VDADVDEWWLWKLMCIDRSRSSGSSIGGCSSGGEETRSRGTSRRSPILFF
jgi:hypothetical protein